MPSASMRRAVASAPSRHCFASPDPEPAEPPPSELPPAEQIDELLDAVRSAVAL